jgi:LmbE family N-acetylglucosaminyl deacetylase
MHKKILVVAAHPDDEVLGCGGTIACHVINGDEVHIVFMSDGVNSRKNIEESKEIERINAAKKASIILGTQEPIFLNFPDNRMDTVALLDIVQSLEEIIHEIRPEVIYTHHNGDLNIDHQITHQAVMTACRPKPEFCVREIYSFEVLSSTEWTISNPFTPNYFVDITATLELKFLALEPYSMEMLDYPNSRSMKGVSYLAKRRGLEVGVNAAECFIVERIIR